MYSRVVLSVEQIDRLLEKGLRVTPQELRYVRWLQQRGGARSTIGDLLVELGARTEDDVRAALEPWMRDLDELDVARATGAHRAEASRGLAAEVMADPDPPVVRLSNVFLLSYVVGRPRSALRIELFAEARVLAGVDGAFEEVAFAKTPALAKLFGQVVARYTVMASLPVARGDLRGRIRLVVGDTCRDIAVERVLTDRGVAFVARRVLPWSGTEPAQDPRLARWRKAMSEGAYEVAIEQARAVGGDATLEELDALVEHVQALLSADRDDEARPFAEQAIAVADERVPHASLRAWLGLLGACARHDVDAAEKHTEALAGEPRAFALSRCASFARDAGQPARAVALATAAEEDSVRWYGAACHWVAAAWSTAAHAELDRGDVARARTYAERIREYARAAESPAAVALARWAEARALDAAGEHDRAIAELGAARAALVEHDVLDREIDAHLAIAHARAGRAQEAAELARAALAFLRPTTPGARALAPIASRSGPFR